MKIIDFINQQHTYIHDTAQIDIIKGLHLPPDVCHPELVRAKNDLIHLDIKKIVRQKCYCAQCKDICTFKGSMLNSSDSDQYWQNNNDEDELIPCHTFITVIYTCVNCQKYNIIKLFLFDKDTNKISLEAFSGQLFKGWNDKEILIGSLINKNKNLSQHKSELKIIESLRMQKKFHHYYCAGVRRIVDVIIRDKHSIKGEQVYSEIKDILGNTDKKYSEYSSELGILWSETSNIIHGAQPTEEIIEKIEKVFVHCLPYIVRELE